MAYLYPPSEYLRPWKVLSLLAGIALLITGSILTPAPDWDIGITFIMAGCTYLTAPCTMRVLLERRWRQLPIAIAATWLSVDGFYALYWHFMDPDTLAFMRSANAPVSLALYGLCGIFWLYRGSLKSLAADARFWRS
jgi:hypothetical protein